MSVYEGVYKLFPPSTFSFVSRRRLVDGFAPLAVYSDTRCRRCIHKYVHTSSIPSDLTDILHLIISSLSWPQTGA